jgi:hypothetical protein
MEAEVRNSDLSSSLAVSHTLTAEEIDRANRVRTGLHHITDLEPLLPGSPILPEDRVSGAGRL